MKQLLLFFLLLLETMNISAQISSDSSKQEQYKQEIQEKLQLDYSMPDYSTSKIDPKVIGGRLATILKAINKTYQQLINLSTLSVIQTSQTEGLSYGRIKQMKLNSITKNGNEIRIEYKTTLEKNNLNLKNSMLIFRFIDGVSDNLIINEFFSNICRYMND